MVEHCFRKAGVRVRFPLLAMGKKLKIFIGALIFALILIIVVIGFFQKNKSLIIEKENEDKNSTYKTLVESAPPDIKKIIDIVDPINEEKINKEINRGLAAEAIKLGIKSVNLQTEILEYLSPYLKKVKVNRNKSEEEYVNEFKSALAPLKIVNPDFNNKESLNNSGEVFLSVLNSLSNMEVSKRLEATHKSEMIILGSMGYIFKKLAVTDNPDEAVALIGTLNTLTYIQEDLINKLSK